MINFPIGTVPVHLSDITGTALGSRRTAELRSSESAAYGLGCSNLIDHGLMGQPAGLLLDDLGVAVPQRERP